MVDMGYSTGRRPFQQVQQHGGIATHAIPTRFKLPSPPAAHPAPRSTQGKRGKMKKKKTKKKRKQSGGGTNRRNPSRYSLISTPRLWERALQVVAACAARWPAGLGGGRGGGLLLPGHGDGPLAVAGVHVGGDLGAREGQHAIVGQGAGDGSLVHVGGQAVAAVEFAGDVAVVVLRGSGERGGRRVRNPPCLPLSGSLGAGNPQYPGLWWHCTASTAGHTSAAFNFMGLRHSSEAARLSAAGRDFGHGFDPRLGSHLHL